MSKIGTEFLSLTNDDMGSPQYPEALPSESDIAEAMDGMRLWDLRHYTVDELEAEIDSRICGVS